MAGAVVGISSETGVRSKGRNGSARNRRRGRVRPSLEIAAGAGRRPLYSGRVRSPVAMAGADRNRSQPTGCAGGRPRQGTSALLQKPPIGDGT